ncbi:VCBS domain-containing protein [Pantoea alfalfae]|uniref:beta strand repeat-containing protein n=1 Tax=Pantoea alfalfae TaxID=3074822 RepID=UPI001CA38B99|nr:BapA/Bap/LapF family large adhesin [Pantoea alfalfae]QZX95256.1 VCBS domain-containing protein [Pantoea alfalfae]
MKTQLIIKDTQGNVIAKHALQPGKSLALESMPQAASYEVHSVDGQPPQKIIASKANGQMKFKLVDDVTGEQYDIILQNVSAEEIPVMTASGSDGVIYAYDYDSVNSVYELVSTSTDPLIADNVYVAGGVLGGLAALIGVAAASNSGGSGVSRNNNSVAANEDNSAATSEDNSAASVVPATTPSLIDDAGNPVADGASTSDSTPTISGGGMQPGSTVVITDGDTELGTATVDADGNWTFTPDAPLADGEHALVVDGTDASGNASSSTVDVIIDTGDTTSGVSDDAGIPAEDNGSDSTPGAGDNAGNPAEGDTSATVPGLTDDAGNPVADGSTTSDSTPTINGGGMEPGSTVVISDGDTELGTATVDADGSWTFTPENPLDDGEHALVIDGTDANGNASSSTVNVTVDTSATVPGLTDDAGNPVADGSTTSDSTPTINGGGMQPGSTVVISDGDTELGTATVDADGNWTFTPDAPLDDGEHALVIDGTDANGNASSSTVDVIIDTSETVPGMTDDAGNPVADGASTSDSTPTINGGGMEPGSTVVISDGDTELGTATVDADGSWTFTPDAPLDDGEHALVIDGTDANGNASSDTVNVNVDTSETVPGLTDDAGNPVADGSTTSDSTPTINGGGMQPGSTVVISDGDTELGTATVDADGNWTFTPDAPLDDGEHALVIDGTDANGNASSSTVDVIIDTSETVPGMTDDAGNPVADGASTSDSTPTINGGGMEPGSTVVITDGNTPIGEATVDADGNWTFTPDTALDDGEHTLITGGIDASGNNVSNAVDVIIDTSATAPVMTDDAGNPVADGSTTSDSTPTLSGGGMEPGSTVTVSDGDAEIGTATVDADGSWTFTPDAPLADGEHALVIDGTNASGNAVSDTVNVTVDTSATAPGLTDDAGNPVADGATTSDSTPTLSGGGMEPGSTVVISDGDTELGTATVDADGSWTFTPDAPLADGEHALVIDGTDANGNAVSDTVNVNVDTSATVPGLTDDAGNPVADGSTTSDSTPTLSGGGMEPGSTVTVSDGDAEIGTATVDADGNWTFTPDAPLADGEHALVVDGTDTNGNAVSDTVNVTVDTSETVPGLTDDAGNPVADGASTSDSTPTLSGGGMEPGSTVIVSDGDTELGTATVDADGSWTFTPDAPLADGEHALVIDGTDANGNAVNDTVNVNVDTSETVPGLTDDAGNPVADGASTSDSTPTLSGGGMQPGSTVVITDGNTPIGEATVDADGNWTFTPDTALDDGEHTLITGGIDASGNNVSNAVDVIIDTSATAPVMTDDAGNPVADGSTTSDSTPTLSGGGMEPGSTVTVSDGDAEIGTATVDADGNWTFTPDAPLADGEHALVIDGTNASGNAVSDTVNVTVDTSATAPGLTDDAGNPVADGATTSDSTPTLSGGGMEPGSTVIVSDGDTELGTATVDADGSWTFTPDSALADGEHALVIDGTDANGNTVSDTVNITVDTSATVPGLTDDAGNPVADGATTSDSTPTLSGGGMQPGSTVNVSDGDAEIGTATVDADGNWTFTPDAALADGDHALVIDGTDANGNVMSDTVNVTVDTSATVPGLTDDAGNPIADGATTSDSTPTLNGGGMKPGSTVTVSDGDTEIGTATVDDDGSWTFTPDTALADGEHALVVDGTDASGNHVNDTINVVVQTAPSMEIVDDNGTAILDGDTISDSTPTFNGKNFEPGTTIVIADGDTTLITVTVGADGSWTFTPTAGLADGAHAIEVTVTDPQGVSASGVFNVTVDTTPPEGVDISTVTMVDNDGATITAAGITADNTPTFSGTALEPGATVIIRDGETVLGETTVSEDGSWSFTPSTSLDDGEHQFTFEVTDEVGNSSGASEALDLSISATKGINTGVVVTDDAGNVIVNGEAINDSTPTFSGQDQTPDVTVTIADGETVLGSVVVAEDGSWSFTPDAALADGDHALIVTVTDAEGNTRSDTINVVVDTVAPDLLDVATVVVSDDAGNTFAAGSAISDTTPTFSTSGQEAGTTIIVRDNGTVLGEAQVADDGSWSFTPSEALTEGDHSFTFETVDAAGNSSGETASVSYLVDSVAPEGVDITTVVITDEVGAAINTAETQSDSKLTFSGSDLEPGATVTMYDKGQIVGETTVDKDGTWTITATDGLYDGTHEVTFTVTDTAGNSSDPSGTLDLNVQAITLTASDNVSSGAAVGFTYPVDVSEDLGTILQDGGLIAFNNKIVSDPIVVADGTIIDLDVTATSSAFVNVASNSTLVLQKYDSSTSTWVTVSEENSGNLFGLFGLGASTSTITLTGLTAGQYQLVYTTSGINVGVSFNLEASKTVYTLAEQGTPTDYTTATGNVITDVDNVYGADGIPHSAYTSVSAASVTNSDGTVTSVTLDATTQTATLVGQYGTLIINADGSYVYTPVSAMESIGKVDTFTYTITDSATGQSSSAQIYVQIGTTNEALDLSWDATDPSATAVTDIASSNEANASVTVTYESSSATNTDVKLVAGGTENYSSTFTLAGNDDLVTGSLSLKTEWGAFGNNFSTPLNITYAVQMQNSDGTWTTVKTQTAVVAAGQHNDEVIQNLEMSSLLDGLGEGTYRVAISTTGATNVVKLDMSVQTVSPTEYVITANEVATGNVLTDEGTDGAVDKLSSIYTRMYAKAGDSTSDVKVDDSYTWVTESGVSIAGQYGTLVIYNNGAYTYTPATTTLPAGSEDVFTYALKGANGEVVNATVTIHLGVEVDGSNGGALVFHGTEVNDVFDVYDTSFASVDGAAGDDTLAWHGNGNGKLVLSDVAAKVSNIESIMLTSTTSSDNLVLDAQSVEDVTSESNALYVKGIAGDSVTLEGTWINSGTVIVDSITYTHYTSTTAAGTLVDIYVQQGVTLSSTPYTDSQNGTEYTVTAAQDVTGTASDDIFNVSDTSFTHIDGGEGLDTLVWSGTGTLTLSELQSKISNIEEIELVNDSAVNNLVVTAQNVADITDADNTLFVKGAITDTLTLSGSWTLAGSEVVNNVDYVHYVGTTADGQTVNLYVDRDMKLSSTETASENNAADVTGDVALLSDSVAQSTTMNTATSSFTSESFTVNSISDLQEINVSVTGTSINASNTVSVNWSLQVYNEQTLRWDNVTSGTQAITSGSPLNVSLEGQNAGTYRIVVDSTQSGHPGFLWSTSYDALTVKVAVNIVSTTDYKVSTSSSVNGSVFTSDSTSDSSLVVTSITAGIVTGAASYTLVAAAGTTIAGTYGSLTIKNDGSYSYTLNSDSVIKLTGSEDSFTYVLADGSTKNLVITLGVSVDGSEGGALIFAGTVGDDSFTVHDTQFTSVDGKSGQDTLVWNGTGELNVSEIADKVNNIEIIDLQDNAQATALLISADDIEKITDTNNVLYVRGGSNDSLSLQGVWAVNGVETLNNITYTLYTSTALDGTAIKLYVQQGLQFNEVAEHLAGSIEDVSADLTVVSVSQNGETTAITDDAVSFKGAYGTLVIDEAGHYSYVVDDAYAHSGNTDTFTYALSDGSNASLSFNLGVDVDGSEGGAITFTGTRGADVFEVYDTDFISINGADGNDTLAWHGTGTLNLSDISARVSNIETIDLMTDAGKDNLVISAESLLKVTDNDNTLYVRGENGDTVTLNGNWEQADGIVANGVNYNHYTSSAADGSVVQLYIEDDITIG